MDEDLNDLIAFATVVRNGGFRAAASRRGVSASALSAAVRRLEERLDTRLIHRTTRSIAPTEVGARLLDRIEPALGEVRTALETVRAADAEPAGTLKLNVPTVAAIKILPDLLARFLADHPRIQVEIMAEDGFVDVLGRGFDAGIRYDESLEQDMIAVPIGPRQDRYACVATPGYLAAHGTPAHPDELLRHRAIRHRFAHGVALPWEFERAGATLRVSPPARVVTNSLETQRAAVLGGLGIACSFEGFYRDLLDTGAVVEILADWSMRFSGPFLYYAGRRHVPAPLRAFIDFLRAEPR